MWGKSRRERFNESRLSEHCENQIGTDKGITKNCNLGKNQREEIKDLRAMGGKTSKPKGSRRLNRKKVCIGRCQRSRRRGQNSGEKNPVLRGGGASPRFGKKEGRQVLHESHQRHRRSLPEKVKRSDTVLAQKKICRGQAFMISEKDKS